MIPKPNESVGQLNSLQNVILVALGVESLKAKVELEEWQNVAVAYDAGTQRFTITITM